MLCWLFFLDAEYDELSIPKSILITSTFAIIISVAGQREKNVTWYRFVNLITYQYDMEGSPTIEGKHWITQTEIWAYE